ncbi:MAG: cytochrome c oxidase subunit II [Fimbriimonas ginsengisoli]|uniref:cytochrome-c oxidase n=1 Tax=Fimbriimonas ginsengisoli TaxID=1005039 RepID=A0A931LXT3_FIMGI|nr:cytochrome c oxidase subunit II [Fimbriimonas ginsengisoli]
MLHLPNLLGQMNFPVAPEQASNFAGEHDLIFYTLVILTIVFTALVGLAMVALAVRFRQGSKVDRSNPKHEHLGLEIGWSLPPLLLGLAVFFLGARLFIKERIPPKDAMEVFVIGKQWMWHMQHANGIRENNTLHLPVGIPVKVTLISQDVLHAFYIPEFRVQYHVVPGRYGHVWFTPTKVGRYHLFCAMYCGTQHSEMGGTVIVQEPAEFARWVQNGGDELAPMTAPQMGEQVWNRYGCGNCHVQSDTERAPTLVGIAGTARKFTDGTSAVADMAYLRESILRPWDRLTVGYRDTMPAYQGQISEEDVVNLVAYMRTMSPEKGALVAAPQGGGRPEGAKPVKERVAAVGALASEKYMDNAPPRKRNLAVGAISAQDGQGYRK